MPYCPKKTKKPEVWRPPGPGGAQGLQTLVFLVFLGQYSIFALFALKRLVFLEQNSTFEAWELSRPGTAKTLYCPKKTNLFKQKQAKMPSCPKKTKKPEVWRPPGPGGAQGLQFFFCFFGTVQHFCTFCLKKILFFWDSTFEAWDCKNSIFALFALKKICFFGTVQHVRGGLQKRCTVPKKPIFLSKNKQKTPYCPKKTKKPKFGDLQALEEPKVSKL